MFFSSQHFLYKHWILYVLKKRKAIKIKTLFKVYHKLSLWLFNFNFEKEISQYLLLPAITRILKGCLFRIKVDDFVVHANIAIFRTLNHDLKFKTKKCKENPLRMCVSFSSPLRPTTYQQEHPFSCTNQQNQKNHF